MAAKVVGRIQILGDGLGLRAEGGLAVAAGLRVLAFPKECPTPRLTLASSFK